MQTNIKHSTRILTIQIEVRYGMQYMFKEIPKLCLKGLWLKEAGFIPGEKVQVEVRHKHLTIKPAR